MGSQILRGLGTLAIFGLAGPLVGLLVLAAGLGILAVISGDRDGLLLVPITLAYGAIFAHYIGFKWALVAGAAALAVAAIRRSAAIWIGALAGVASYALSALAGATWMPTGIETTLVGKVIAGFPLGFAIVMALVHVAAASVSWWIARRLVHR